MKLHRFWPRSLKARLTTLTLLIVVVSFLLLGFYSKSLLREELLRFTGEQQRSALALVNTEVTQGLQDRLASLSAVASHITPSALSTHAIAQDFLRERPFLDGLFNGGVVLWNAKHQLLADARFKERNAIADALDSQDLAQILDAETTVIGNVHMLEPLKIGVFAMGVPVRDPQGQVIGALVGTIRLDEPNFLSQVTRHTYGQTGHFFLIEPRHRLIFATSDTSRLMEVLPPPGSNPWIDRFMQGFEGTARVINPHGEEVLVSIKQIALTHWYASITLSSDEAFGMITAVQPRVRAVGVVLMLALVALIGWMVRWQLAPMTSAVQTMAGFVHQEQPPQALTVVRQDEVGELVGGFNRLLDVMAQQQKVLRNSEWFKQSILNSVTAKIAVLNHEGVIIEVNDAWQQDRVLDGLDQEAGEFANSAVGTHFLATCESIGTYAEGSETLSIADGIRAVLGGRLPRFYIEYANHSAQQRRWSSMSVTTMLTAESRGAVISIEDITQRVAAQNQVRELAFYDPLTRLPNRRLALERLTQQISHAKRTLHRMGLLFIDLDKFKPVNDTLGHEVGDWLLQNVAQRIQSCLRASDTAARMGGDEFVILLPEVANREAAVAVAEKIHAALVQEFVTPKGVVLQISASIGVALYPDHGRTDKDLLRAGDEAMYLAKKREGNAVVVCETQTSAPTPADTDDALESFVHLRWKPSFACGNASIDDEHKTLFELVNTLLDRAAVRHEQEHQFEAAFSELMAHTREHFAHEEAILRARGWTDIDQHAQIHEKLLVKAQTLYTQAHAAPRDKTAARSLIKFLVSDLVANHLLHDDKDYFAFFAQPD
ncbi:diguanylate cyclase domain-containing protein [Rhodoferax sp.]|uniref:diguanylate cyclase domain-containing protein n=1 Tax=Rhodoferax sp. TaxID=50421 RepID=UPI00284952E0|nr:diguanylate cyclase [Rhodoferax sp.]MDR3370166.1 diguanylate cyclase [Rhodoferax sp.]